MTRSRKIAVILSGSGVYDGSEIHEACMTLLAIVKLGASYEIFAPDKEQHHVINHLTGQETSERRNVLVESARIARGKIRALDAFAADGFDGLVLPGGFGAAKNLSSFAFDGVDCRVDPGVEKAIQAMVARGKPVGALCISPVILAKVLGNIRVTIGQDAGTAKAVEQMGATHVNTGHGEVAVDTKKKIVTSPCYMLDADIAQVALCAENTIKSMMELM